MPCHQLSLSEGFLLLQELYNRASNLWYVGHEALCHWLITSLLSHGVNEAKTTALIDRWVSLLQGVLYPNMLYCCHSIRFYYQYLLNPYYVQISALCDTGAAKQNERGIWDSFCPHNLVVETDAFTNRYTTKQIMLSTIIEAQSVVGNQRRKINSNPWGCEWITMNLSPPQEQQLTTYVIITVG